MDDRQIFQLISILYLAVGIGIIINSGFYKRLISDFMSNPPAIYIGGLLAIFAGFLFVTFHNIWAKDPTVLITILGWIVLIKGLLLVILPDISIKITNYWIGQAGKLLTTWAIVAIIIGIFSGWLGFIIYKIPPQ